MKRLKVLLLQARRPDDPMKDHEVRCFVERTGLPADAIVAHNLYDGAPRRAQLRGIDTLMVGGSGDFYVSRGNLPEFDRFLDFLRRVVDAGPPTFASCFGFQALVRALDGTVIHDPGNKEVGTFELELTEAGRDDPLFGRLPHRFMAQLGHKDRADTIGGGVVNLASSERSRFQALRVPGKPVWATQFHPELVRETNVERLRCYLEAYGPGAIGDVDAMFAGFKESPDTPVLLPEFLRLVFG